VTLGTLALVKSVARVICVGAMVTMRGAQPEGVHLAVFPRLSNNELPTVLCLSSLDKGCKGSANEQSLQESGINSLSPHERSIK